MVLRKIISGGQTGADQGGIKAGSWENIETGGWIPNGFLTEDGPNPSLAKYGIKEHSSDKYPPRTFTNAKESDGTIRFAVNFDTAGEKCTLKAIQQYNKPYIDVDVADPISVQKVTDWIIENKIEVLNVAGNREKTWPGLCKFVENYLIEVIKLLRNKNEDSCSV